MTPNSPLSDLSRNLLSAARDEMSPDAAAMERVRARVAAAVAAPVAVTMVATPAKATAASALPIKIGVAALLVAGLAGVFVAWPRGGHEAGAPQLSTRHTEIDEPRAAVHVAATEPSAPKQATVATPPAAPVATLAREVELIDLAMLALRRGAPGAALDSIALYDRETRGRGQMAEDAAAIAIEAHCTLGHDVRSRLAAFDRAYPSSAQRPRIAATCR